MLGRKDKLDSLNQNYNSGKNNITILYGRHGMGKTTLVNEFIKGKKCFYYEAAPGADFEQFRFICNAAGYIKDDYSDLFEAMYEDGINLFVFEEFHQLVKNGNNFMDGIINLISNHVKVMVILGCSSVAWVENSMIKAIGNAAFKINTFMKLKEFDYSDTVNLFPELDAMKLLSIYGITGGNPKYISCFDAGASVKDNVCRLFLDKNGLYFNEAFNYIKDEFREIGVYNTILYCLASGRNKLNEIHEYTGYGRDKISVYLKNLMAREIVEKVFSYDYRGSENTKKGLYRIKDGFIDFWYGFVYPFKGRIGIMQPEDFYDYYIEGRLDGFLNTAYVKIAGEMLEIMNEMRRLPFEVTRKGSWYGKNGDISLIFENNKGKAIIGQVYTKNSKVSNADVEKLMKNVKLAGIDAKNYYLFSVYGFYEDVRGDNITTVTIDEL